MQTNELHKANLLAVETQDDESLAFAGKHSIEQFIMWLDDRVEKEDTLLWLIIFKVMQVFCGQ